MGNFRLVLEYDGTGFEGWQSQPEGHRTVQGCLHEAVEKVTASSASVMGSGRTDTGVHAAAQVANVRVETRLGPEELQRALNATLPRDVAVLQVEAASEGFDARRDALSKRYGYRLFTGAVRSPLRERRAWWVPGPLDLDAMARAAGSLEGRHDFASFQAAGSSVRSTVRALAPVELEPDGDDLRLGFEADGFLRYMVRNLVGTLVEVGRGRLAADAVGDILAARDRARAPATAPARGLTLESVRYDGFESGALSADAALRSIRRR